MQFDKLPKGASKYRRAFDWRLFAIDRDEIPTASAAFAALGGRENSEILEDYLEISRKRRSNRKALAKLQIHLLEDLLEAEVALKYFKQEHEKIEATKAEVPDEKGDDGIRKDFEAIKREIFFHKAHANCLRAIGDGIVWRALAYDRAALRSLSQNPNKAHVLTEGTLHELTAWSLHFDSHDGIPILNSLTNCLTTGDITLVRDDGSVEIVEIKSSKTKSRRITRQKQRMREVFELLNFGEGELENARVKVLRLDIFPENGLDDLRGLLQEAERSGYAARRLSNFLYVECIDVGAIKDIDGVLAELNAKENRELADWSASKDFVTLMSSSDLISFSPNCAPFSVFPFPSKTCIDLLTGVKSYRTHFNFAALGREFERMGWAVERNPQQLHEEQGSLETGFFVVSKGGFHATVPPADIMRLQAETMRPKVLISELEEIRRMGPEVTLPNTLVIYEGEAQIWD
jgi:hypothetical protein